MKKLKLTKFWKIIKRIWRIFQIVLLYTAFTLILFLGAYMALGFMGIVGEEMTRNSFEFIKTLAIISFTLAGFTFLSSTLKGWVTEKEHAFISISQIFLLSGFFCLLFMALNFLPPTDLSGKPLLFYNFLRTHYLGAAFLGILLFAVGLATLIIKLTQHLKETRY